MEATGGGGDGVTFWFGYSVLIGEVVVVVVVDPTKPFVTVVNVAVGVFGATEVFVFMQMTPIFWLGWQTAA